MGWNKLIPEQIRKGSNSLAAYAVKCRLNIHIDINTLFEPEFKRTDRSGFLFMQIRSL